MKFPNIEKLLPFGYLILVILGLIKESVFYYQLGINILKYSNIMDILLSPISDLTSYPLVLFTFMGYLFLVYLMFYFASKNLNKDWAKKLVDSKNSIDHLTDDEIKLKLGQKFLNVILICIMCYFLGIGIGNGKIVAERIAKNELKYNHKITFNNDETEEVYLIGNNSSNIFYVEKDQKNVMISPISALKSIEILKKQKQ